MSRWRASRTGTTGSSTTNGADLVYGGWGPDELQADQGGAGPQAGSDQLIDWVGNHNVYFVCNGAYGAGRTIRESSPDMMTLLATWRPRPGPRP